jgi:hypothetical protein
LIQDAAADGWLSPLPRSRVPARSRNTVVAPPMPRIHPARNPPLVPPALGARSIRMTAMIGMGEIATPTASGRRSPTTCPMSPPPLRSDGYNRSSDPTDGPSQT